MGRVFDGVGDNRFFRFKIDPVLRVGNPASPLQQRLDTAFLDRVAIALARPPRSAEPCACLRIRRLLVVSLHLDDGEGVVGPITENVVRPPLPAPPHLAADEQ